MLPSYLCPFLANPSLPQTYYRTASLPLLRSYFSCLFRALSATHKLHIIHRDVKPANFLYDITTGEGVLCDYGLAQKVGGDECYEWKSDCLHSLPGPAWTDPHARARVTRPAGYTVPPSLNSGLHGVRLAKPMSLYEQARAMEEEWAQKLDALEERENDGEDVPQEEYDALEERRPWKIPSGWHDELSKRFRERQPFVKGWRSALEVARQKAKQRPGVLKEDRRPSIRANRAGTRGFRAPEVLLKCPDQTVGASGSPSSPSLRRPAATDARLAARSARHLVRRDHPPLLPHPPLPLLQLKRRHRSSRRNHRHLWEEEDGSLRFFAQ